MELPKVIINGDARYYAQAVAHLESTGRSKFDAEFAVRTILIALRQPSRRTRECLKSLHLDTGVINDGLRAAMRDIANACINRPVNLATIAIQLFGHTCSMAGYALLEMHFKELEAELPEVAAMTGAKR